MEGTFTQKSLFIILIGLITLITLFSFMATENLGKDGYDKCIQNACEKKGQEYCQKFRVANNCCQGAGGKLAISGSERICSFN